MTLPDTAPDAPPAVARRLPRLSEVRELVRFRAFTLNPVDRRLARALTIEDLRRIGRRTTPRAVFDYVDGAADAEVTVRRNAAAFENTVFLPEALHPVRDPDLSTTLLGRRISLPLVFAPTGYTRMMHHEGEAAVARVAARNGIPYALSTVGTATAEDVRDAAPAGDNWFQLYVTNNERLNRELVDRARDAGFSTLVLTIDTAVAGRRLKDVRNGLTIPPELTLRTFLGMARFPYWWFNKLTTPPVGFASIRDFPGSSADVARLLFDPGLSHEDLVWLRQAWPGKLLVKGVLWPADAKRAMDLGADGVVVSNHGGRQLDRTPATLDMLPAVREAVGERATVLLDGGVRYGQDIAAAVALGADAVMAGRAYLYGLMAGGERGVTRALEILRTEYQRTLQLLGLDATGKLSGRHVCSRSDE
ncbi:alpha-hydroxy-acid oxidizing protein [Amycolatopsis acidiphila]|uniref:Alpha-hydroxy-acid oxidizing protein n=1 Tax=Amycolatopsis acidiphila TaxID=715473 RepID=A0A558ALZ0_9PSEU|nr:alpha-hydroxy acid oxidase [Amycolatopsis acidiphila]TVT25276.1 alpha-hydroxy-acid oxidizing protein [Amycolatopsis acidiphila]UIJ62396.1 alpha-hydroxy-acid oxidizing protein [Amycolatopsis acidiphila]GHG83451.1 alpha-hydroxy-acid oxidizing enzyme [Amycolatopsis acidiphila]